MIDELLRRRAAAAPPSPASARPTLHVAVLTCMDARIDPAALFSAQPGELHVLRNAGGAVTDDMIRSLTISQRKLGTTQVLLVQHTRCGMATFTDDEFSAEVELDSGMHPPWRIHSFRDPEQGVQRGLTRLRRSPYLRQDSVIRGFVLDVDTGALTEVNVPEVSSP